MKKLPAVGKIVVMRSAVGGELRAVVRYVSEWLIVLDFSNSFYNCKNEHSLYRPMYHKAFWSAFIKVDDTGKNSKK